MYTHLLADHGKNGRSQSTFGRMSVMSAKLKLVPYATSPWIFRSKTQSIGWKRGPNVTLAVEKDWAMHMCQREGIYLLNRESTNLKYQAQPRPFETDTWEALCHPRGLTRLDSGCLRKGKCEGHVWLLPNAADIWSTSSSALLPRHLQIPAFLPSVIGQLTLRKDLQIPRWRWRTSRWKVA